MARPLEAPPTVLSRDPSFDIWGKHEQGRKGTRQQKARDAAEVLEDTT